MHDNDIGAVLLDQGAAGGQEVLDHHVLVGTDVLELEPGGAAAGDERLHPVIARLRDLPRDHRFMVADDSEALAELGRDVKHRLARPDNRDVDQRAPAVDPEIERAERHRRVIALALRLQVGGVEIGRHQLDFRRTQAAEWGGLDRQDADLDLRSREAPGHVLAQAAFLGRIVTDDEGYADHGSSLYPSCRASMGGAGGGSMVSGAPYHSLSTGATRRC